MKDKIKELLRDKSTYLIISMLILFFYSNSIIKEMGKKILIEKNINAEYRYFLEKMDINYTPNWSLHE